MAFNMDFAKTVNLSTVLLISEKRIFWEIWFIWKLILKPQNAIKNFGITCFLVVLFVSNKKNTCLLASTVMGWTKITVSQILKL